MKTSHEATIRIQIFEKGKRMHRSIYDYLLKKATPAIVGLVLLLIMTTFAFKGDTSNPSLIVNEMDKSVTLFNSTIPSFNNNSTNILSGDPPITAPDTFIMLQATGISGDLLGNDSDPDGDPLVINTTPAQSPTNGVVTINADGTFSYTPYAYFVGTDYCQYQVCDGAAALETNTYDSGNVPMVITQWGAPTI